MLEAIVAKLKTIERIFKEPNRFQIVGMSATLGGLNTLEKWLDKATIYHSDHRPVPLAEYTLDARSATLSLEPAKN